MNAVRWLVAGRVQGVGFRWFTLKQAMSLHLRGWVMNLPDGRVEVVAKGEGHGLDTLDRILRQGPRGARVDSVERMDFPHEQEIDNTFTIK